MDGPILIQVTEDQKSILRQLIELYEYDFSEFNDAYTSGDYTVHDVKTEKWGGRGIIFNNKSGA